MRCLYQDCLYQNNDKRSNLPDWVSNLASSSRTDLPVSMAVELATARMIFALEIFRDGFLARWIFMVEVLACVKDVTNYSKPRMRCPAGIHTQHTPWALCQGSV